MFSTRQRIPGCWPFAGRGQSRWPDAARPALFGRRGRTDGNCAANGRRRRHGTVDPAGNVAKRIRLTSFANLGLLLPIAGVRDALLQTVEGRAAEYLGQRLGIVDGMALQLLEAAAICKPIGIFHSFFLQNNGITLKAGNQWWLH